MHELKSSIEWKHDLLHILPRLIIHKRALTDPFKCKNQSCWEWYLLDHSTNRGGLFSEPLWVPFILTVHLHLLRTEGHAAVAVEIQTIMSAHISPLLLRLTILWLQKLRQAWLGSLWPKWKCEIKQPWVTILASQPEIKQECSAFICIKL